MLRKTNHQYLLESNIAFPDFIDPDSCFLFPGIILFNESHRNIVNQIANCKVIRIGKRVQPDISKARQQVNIDRPAYNKTDKQCRTRTTITARLPDD